MNLLLFSIFPDGDNAETGWLVTTCFPIASLTRSKAAGRQRWMLFIIVSGNWQMVGAQECFYLRLKIIIPTLSLRNWVSEIKNEFIYDQTSKPGRCRHSNTSLEGSFALFFFFLLQFTSFDISGPTFTPAPNYMSLVPSFTLSLNVLPQTQHYQNRTPYLSAYSAFAASFFLFDINIYDINTHFLIVVLDSWIWELIK